MNDSDNDRLPFFKAGNVAVGFIAIGNVAYGYIAIGLSVAVGPVAIGINALGTLLALGVNTLALLSFAGVNAGGFFTLAGVNAFGGIGGAGVNSGIHPLIGIVVGIGSLVAAFVIPKGTSPVALQAPGPTYALQDLMTGRVATGWVSARVEPAQPGFARLLERKTEAVVQLGAEAARYLASQSDRPPRDMQGFFDLSAVEELRVPTDANYRFSPDRMLRLTCHRALLIEPLPPWYERKSTLHRVNKVLMLIAGIVSIAGSVLALIL